MTYDRHFYFDMQELQIPIVGLELESDGLELGSSGIALTADVLGNYAYQHLGIRYTLCTPEENGLKARRTLDRVLTTFKLFKDKFVTAHLIFIEGGKKYDELPHYSYFRQDPPADYETVYELLKREESSFKHHFRECESIDPQVFSITRFHHADYRPFLRDRYIDYVFSLDALLIPPRGKRPRHMFVKNGSAVFGKKMNPESLRGLRKELEDIYDFRGAIVHGNDEEYQKYVGKMSLIEHVRSARGYAREAIKYFQRQQLISDPEKRYQHLESIREPRLSS